MVDYTIEIPSIKQPPINLGMCDSINCPICDIDLSEELNIDLSKFEVDNDTSIYCTDCDLKINFKIVKI